MSRVEFSYLRSRHDICYVSNFPRDDGYRLAKMQEELADYVTFSMISGSPSSCLSCCLSQCLYSSPPFGDFLCFM